MKAAGEKSIQPTLTSIALALLVGTLAVVADRSQASTADHFFGMAKTTTASQVSANWAGYAVTGSTVAYTSVTATWRQPKVTCTSADAGNSAAFWVGLGGLTSTSQALEQTGTSSDCDKNGKPSYSAWYEIVPSPSVPVKLTVRPGDLITASVNVLNGTTIELQLKNRTLHTSFTTKQTFATPDLTSAEWIAEAPSACNEFRCQTVPLANFGSVAFTRIAALGNGIGGTITANPGWDVTSISLAPSRTRGFFPGPDTFSGSSPSSTSGAAPGSPSSDGRGFTVGWSATSSTS